MFAAAVASESVRESFIDGIHSYLSTTLNGLGDVPFAVIYNPMTANELVTSSDTGGMARSVLMIVQTTRNLMDTSSFAQGAVFAPIALKYVSYLCLLC